MIKTKKAASKIGNLELASLWTGFKRGNNRGTESHYEIAGALAIDSFCPLVQPFYPFYPSYGSNYAPTMILMPQICAHLTYERSWCIFRCHIFNSPAVMFCTFHLDFNIV